MLCSKVQCCATKYNVAQYGFAQQVLRNFDPCPQLNFSKALKGLDLMKKHFNLCYLFPKNTAGNKRSKSRRSLLKATQEVTNKLNQRKSGKGLEKAGFKEQ